MKLYECSQQYRVFCKGVLRVQAYAKSFTVLLLSIVIKALASGVVQNIPFAILSDILPPEQLG